MFLRLQRHAGNSRQIVGQCHVRLVADVVKRKGDRHPVVVACTLPPNDSRFELGRTLSRRAAPYRSTTRTSPNSASSEAAPAAGSDEAPSGAQNRADTAVCLRISV